MLVTAHPEDVRHPYIELGRTAGRWIATLVVRWYANLYRRLMNPLGQRLELAAIMPWADLAPRVLAPSLVTDASRIAERMRTRHPAAHGAAAALAAAVDDATAGHGVALVLTFEPGLAGLAPVHLAPIAKALLEAILGALFIGALLDAGAELKKAIGRPDLICLFQGEEVVPRRITRDAMTSDSSARELHAWSRRLLASERLRMMSASVGASLSASSRA